jgi:hypothetical protein
MGSWRQVGEVRVGLSLQIDTYTAAYVLANSLIAKMISKSDQKNARTLVHGEA